MESQVSIEYIYPTGKKDIKSSYSADEMKEMISQIKELCSKLIPLVEILDDKQLELSYRPNGWTIRQIIHHLADSHMNAYIRCKLAVEQGHANILGYNHEVWAEMKDGKTAPIYSSLKLLEGLQHRWAWFLKHLEEADLNKTYFHPEYGTTVPIWEVIATYAWHGNHHYAQIKGILERNSFFI